MTQRVTLDPRRIAPRLSTTVTVRIVYRREAFGVPGKVSRIGGCSNRCPVDKVTKISLVSALRSIEFECLPFAVVKNRRKARRASFTRISRRADVAAIDRSREFGSFSHDSYRVTFEIFQAVRSSKRARVIVAEIRVGLFSEDALYSADRHEIFKTIKGSGAIY